MTATDSDLVRLIEEAQHTVHNQPAKLGTAPILGARELAGCIDHTLLKLDATPRQVDALCEEAKEWGFKTVCVRLKHVNQAVLNLQQSSSGICCVVGFPEGTQTLEEKLQEAASAERLGANELDTVINVDHLRSQSYGTILKELKAFRDLFAKPKNECSGTVLKLILETSQLSEAEIIAGCKLASLADFDYVKTSTGFRGHGAKAEHVMLMKHVANMEGKGMKVKASGGIKTLNDAMTMLGAGADRLGVSAGIAIVKELNANS